MTATLPHLPLLLALCMAPLCVVPPAAPRAPLVSMTAEPPTPPAPVPPMFPDWLPASSDYTPRSA